MLLHELFSDGPADDENLSVVDRLRLVAIDYLTPLVAQKVPFVTVQQMIDMLRRARPGIQVDRTLIMTLMDPDIIKSVKSIEGDRINLQVPGDLENKVDDDGAEEEINKIKNMAKDKAKKDITKK